MLRPKPTIKIVATILAKNEEDIIAKNIEHHIEQGVSAFIVTDNNSKDQTREIVARYPEVKELIEEPGSNHNQSEWVTRMARLACKLEPDWIVHLDADELWCGLFSLRTIKGTVATCERMYLHPPVEGDFSVDNMRWFIDLDHAEIPQEAKVAHRPDTEIVIEHGNHAVRGVKVEYTQKVWRHHYPVRSYDQWCRKAQGHLALMNRNSVCERWKNWYTLLHSNNLREKFNSITGHWKSLVQGSDNFEDFLELLEFWATPDVIQYFKENRIMPRIGEWPYAKQNILDQRRSEDR